MGIPLPLDPVLAQQRLDAFDSILISHPRMANAHARFEALAGQTRARVAQNELRVGASKGRPIKPAELWLMPLIGPAGSGKSASISSYIDKIYKDPKTPDGAIPALVVTLRSSTKTPRQLQHQILEAYGDPAAHTTLTDRDYSEARVNESIRAIARRCDTAILLLDEAHNLLAGGLRAKEAMCKAFKSLLNDGLFSIVLSGTYEVASMLSGDTELQSRQKETIDFGKLQLNAPDMKYFINFVTYLEREMIERKVIDAPIGLTASAEERGFIYDMADGVVGIVSRIVRLALERAFIEGKTELTWEHITHAFRAWKQTDSSNPNAKRYDPFVDGVRPATRQVVASLSRIAA